MHRLYGILNSRHTRPIPKICTLHSTFVFISGGSNGKTLESQSVQSQSQQTEQNIKLPTLKSQVILNVIVEKDAATLT